jgi:WD40 repeat protein/serine/threonine protein kinase
MAQPPLERLEALFHEVADLGPEQRSTLLDARCAGDPELRAAVEDLLRQEAGAGPTESFLVSPFARPEASTRAGVPPSDSAGAESPPPTIPGYEVQGELGRGGMGVVYKARQTALHRVVALKMLRGGAPVTAEQLARFRVEMEALGRLQHPNIVQIYEVGEWEGRPYFTMEYVAGPNLAQKLGGAPLPARAAAHLVEVLARAMEAVHRCHVLHRDLKPANVLLQPEEGGSGKEGEGEGHPSGPSLLLPPSSFVPKIGDFGLAKLAKDTTTAAKTLTQAGQAMGTPCYMAPEQARGEAQALGPATDVYALGAILYEALTGRPPFEGTTSAETIARVLDDEPVSPASLRPKLPRDLVTICLKCLEKDPRQRYAGAGELAEDLRLFRAGEPIRARPVGRVERLWRWCRRRPAVAALWGLSVATALALALAALLYHDSLQKDLTAAKQKAEAEQRLAEAERRQQVRLDVLLAMHDLDAGDSFPALLRLTEALRLDENRPDEGHKHRVRIATALRQCPELRHLLVLGGAPLGAQPGPGGGWLVVAAEGAGAVVVDVETGKPAGPPLKSDAPVLRAALSPDGRLLAAACADDTVRLWDVETGKAHLPPLPQGGPVNRLAFHPGGRALLTRRADSRAQLWDVRTGRRVPLQGLPEFPFTYSAFSEDGRWVFTLDVRQTGRVWDAATGKEVGPPWALGQGVSWAAFSPDGRRVALAGTDNAVRVGDVATGKLSGAPLKWPQAVTRVAFSPGGGRLLTVCADNTVWVEPTAGGRLPRAPLRHESTVTQARFSPDGRLVITGGDDNHARVWDATTGEAVTPFLRHNGCVLYAAFSGDGKEALTVGRDRVVRWWRPRAAPGTVTGGPVAEGPPAPAEVRSPDGRRVLRWTNGHAVQVTDAATGAPVGLPLRHSSTVEHAAFSPTGRRVVTAGDDNTARVWDAETGELVLPPLPHKGTVHYAAFSPDGGSLITASADHTARVWDAATAEPLTPPLKHPCAVVRADFRPDGRQALTVGADRLRRTWDLTPTDRPLRDLSLLAQVLAGSRIDEQNRLAPLDGAALRSAWQELRAGHPSPAGEGGK